MLENFKNFLYDLNKVLNELGLELFTKIGHLFACIYGRDLRNYIVNDGVQEVMSDNAIILNECIGWIDYFTCGVLFLADYTVTLVALKVFNSIRFYMNKMLDMILSCTGDYLIGYKNSAETF